MWGRQGGGTGVTWNVGNNICSWTIEEVTVVIEMLVDE